MEISISKLIFTHKNIKVSMGQQYPYPTRQEQNAVAILRIYGAIHIFLLFFDHQDTEFE